MALLDVGPGPCVFAVDVGGTGIKSALVDEAGHFVAARTRPTPIDPANPAGVVIDAITDLRRELAEETGLAPQAAGVLIPGLVDDDRGVGVMSGNLGWRDVPFRALLTERLGLPVKVMHDVRGAGLAEYRLGHAAHYQHVVVLTIGTGIAGALFLDGRPFSAGGYAGEVGHCVVLPDGPLCVCGRRGCLEAVSSAAAVARAYTERTGRPVTGGREVMQKALASDPDAVAVWDRAVEGLALGIAELCSVLGPECVLLAGGFSGAEDRLLDPLNRRLAELLSFHRHPVVMCSRIKGDAGLVGAGLCARDLEGSTQGPAAPVGGVQ